jgi:WhiB family redox-sensing transcriptional regulator
VFVSDDLILRLLAAALDQADIGDLVAAVRAGPARCATGWRPPDTWHVADSPRHQAATRPAVRVCRRCEVAAPCGLLATARREPWGIWGAMTESQRRHLLRLLDQITDRAVPRKPGRPAGSRVTLPPIRRTAAELARVRPPRRPASATPTRPAP